MYIAFRWLIGLSLAMWVAVCYIDFISEANKRQYKGYNVNQYKSENITKTTRRRGKDVKMGQTITPSDLPETVLFHYAMFFAGALAVSLFNRKKEIILYTRTKILYINICAMNFLRDADLKRTAVNISVAIRKYAITFWENFKEMAKNYLSKRKAFQSHYKIHLELVKKMKEYVEERKNLGQLLISAIRENKNIRLQYQMETMAKNRLLRYVEDTQKQIKENHSKYVSFQHLYLVTHQENVFLKARLKKVCQEKGETEKNLINLVNKVYQSTNNELKAYCSHFIVRTRDNLLNSDVNKEIQKFLQKSSTASSSCQNSFDYGNLETSSRISEILSDDETLVPIVSDAPKLKGLPGECIWTIKDKDGIIEKLYEYDYTNDFDKGDTVRRIRKYSVYHDKDCLLDFATSRTALCDLHSTSFTLQQQQCIKVEYPLINHRFLTGSQAFQKFLQDNQNLNIVQTSHRPALLCE